MKFSGEIVYETKNNLKHFRVVVINPLNPRLIFFYESIIISTIMEQDRRLKRRNTLGGLEISIQHK